MIPHNPETPGRCDGCGTPEPLRRLYDYLGADLCGACLDLVLAQPEDPEPDSSESLGIR